MWLILGGVLLIVVGLIAVGLVVVNELKPKPGPSYPKAWDSRVAPYAKIASKKRGLNFMHPVTVKFLPAKPFEKTVTADEKKLNKKDRKGLEEYAGLLRALGMIHGDVDLFKAFNDVSSGGILAYYSPTDKTITVRGEKVTPAIAGTLVHELTHVLQDQHFAIGRQQERLRKRAAKSGSSAEASVLDAIIEGDAQRVQTLYRESLPAKRRKALDRGQNADAGRAGKRMKAKQVPPVIVTLQSAPYVLGEAMVQAAAVDGGNVAVDTLLRDSPTEETALLDPLRGLRKHQKATQVAVPRLARGEKKLDSDEFGVLSWYLLLSERVPLQEALAAADGWAGDEYVGFKRRGASCARMNYTGRAPSDTTRMLQALQHWVAAAPGSPAKVSLEDGLVRFESCDPGAKARAGKDSSGQAIGLAANRAYIGIQYVKAGFSNKVSRCMGGRMTTAFSGAQLTDQAYISRPDVQGRMQRMLAGCRS